MNILLTGAAGQLGNELLPLLSARGKVTATDRMAPSGAIAGWLKMDISDSGRLEAMLNRLRPELIVNTAAYTAVDQAESDAQTCFAVNEILPRRLADWASRNDARLIHYSTDYVFNGQSSKPYLEADTPDPKNVYGDSKLAGELAIQNSGCKHVILRTSWVYSSHGKNFVLSMLELARRGLSLNIVDDQQGCPTSARSLAVASDAVIQCWQNSSADEFNGLFHYCDDRRLSWYEFANTIFELAVAAGLLQRAPELTPVASSGFPQPALRPKWSVLDTGKVSRVFSIQSASFDQSLQTVINQLALKG